MQLKQTFSLKQSLSIRQILVPKMIHMLKTFQQPYSDLVEQVEKESRDNVFLEVTRQDQLMAYASHRKLSAGPNYSQGFSGDGTELIKDNQTSFYALLISQLNLQNLGQKEVAIADLLIQHIDSRGFIPDYEDVRAKIQAKFGVSERKVHDILKIIQTFEPDGVGARNLKECLLIQIEAYQFDH